MRGFLCRYRDEQVKMQSPRKHGLVGKRRMTMMAEMEEKNKTKQDYVIPDFMDVQITSTIHGKPPALLEKQTTSMPQTHLQTYSE